MKKNIVIFAAYLVMFVVAGNACARKIDTAKILDTAKNVTTKTVEDAVYLTPLIALF